MFAKSFLDVAKFLLALCVIVAVHGAAGWLRADHDATLQRASEVRSSLVIEEDHVIEHMLNVYREEVGADHPWYVRMENRLELVNQGRIVPCSCISAREEIVDLLWDHLVYQAVTTDPRVSKFAGDFEVWEYHYLGWPKERLRSLLVVDDKIDGEVAAMLNANQDLIARQKYPHIAAHLDNLHHLRAEYYRLKQRWRR